MNKAKVYYFSGTGNSLVLAKLVAERLGGDLIPIASVIDREKIEPVANVVGIVFPVYYADLPNIVRRFAEKLENTEGKYIFAICNYGGGAGDSLKTLDRILRSRGKALSAGFGVHMPQNAFHKPWEMKSLAHRQAPKRIDVIARSIAARRTGLFYSNVLVQGVMTPFQGWIRRMTALYLEKASNTSAPSGLTVEQLMPLADKSFAVDENCNSCGTCVRVCPVGNIEIVDKKPVWQNRCENCLACFNWCPTNAIHGALANSGYRYHHPYVTARDIAEQIDIPA
ncbi:MAG: EFR1 family ferrodoxin [Candidatus Bipolaricaulota bacterium]|nr:EFR1 family ferrodoxin [Candidatus Bipolaricaulota bacterium]